MQEAVTRQKAKIHDCLTRAGLLGLDGIGIVPLCESLQRAVKDRSGQAPQ